MSGEAWDGLLDDELGRRIASDALLEQGIDVRQAATPSAWIYALRPPGSRRLALRCEPLRSGLRWVHAARATRVRLGLALLLLLLAGCVPIGVEPGLEADVARSWSRFSDRPVSWTAVRVIGLPFAGLVADEQGARGVMLVPAWPLSWGRACDRAWMRYELAKIAHTVNAGPWWPLAALDSLLHLPPSEIRSWLAVFAPPPVPRPQRVVLSGWVTYQEGER